VTPCLELPQAKSGQVAQVMEQILLRRPDILLPRLPADAYAGFYRVTSQVPAVHEV
jgi:hypothetical protein